MLILHNIVYCGFLVSLEVRKWKTPNTVLHQYIFFGYSGSLPFPYEF